jgi:hypothetical protein
MNAANHPSEGLTAMPLLPPCADETGSVNFFGQSTDPISWRTPTT